MMAVNKPAGTVVHPTYRHMTGTLMNALLWRARSWPSPQRPSIVGRLDRGTSGIVVAAKSPAAHAALQRDMASDSAVKEYLAFVYGRVRATTGRIALRLARDPRDRRIVVASQTAGAPSLTAFVRLASVAVPRRRSARADGRSRSGLSLLRCRIATGRMHQIRVHLAACGWPIVGDPKYGDPRWSLVADTALREALRQFPRQALHAWRLELTHPATRRRLEIEAPVPRDICELMRHAGIPFARRMLPG
jgi:23S rRNA pseudouridine1911/1915/1917 synthase